MRFRRKKGVYVGLNTEIFPTCSILVDYGQGGVISIGDNCRIGCSKRKYWAGTRTPTQLTALGEGASIVIGNGCILNGVSIFAREGVEIGDGCIFATGIQILDGDQHEVVSANHKGSIDRPRKITIGRNVWVGLNAIILKGTEIGDNSVVGAGAVVRGKFPANCVIAGNPAKVVKTFEI